MYDVDAPRAQRRIPVLLVTGVDETAMLSCAISLQCGLPGAVSVSHTIDPERQVLTRTVSDLAGAWEREEIRLAHTCASCAVREDIVPTLERLAAAGRWHAIIACLPVAAEATQVCRAIGWTPHAVPHVSIGAVVTALDGTTIPDDLLGDDLLAERGRATSSDDRRAVGEAACALIEYADAVCLTGLASTAGRDLVAALIRPGAAAIDDPSLLDAALLLADGHRLERTEAWAGEVRRAALPPLPAADAWQLDLSSSRPFHPGRLYAEIAALGGGRWRSRGCFHLPSRPRDVCRWDGAGGQVSVGTSRQWARDEAPLTRIVVTGLGDTSDQRAGIQSAFRRCLLTDAELASRGAAWRMSYDGLEPWLGPIAEVA